MGLQLAKVLHSYDGHHWSVRQTARKHPTTNMDGYLGTIVKIKLLQVDTVVL